MIATPFEGLAERHFVGAHTVEIAVVEQGDAMVEGGVDRGNTLLSVSSEWPYMPDMPMQPRASGYDRVDER